MRIRYFVAALALAGACALYAASPRPAAAPDSCEATLARANADMKRDAATLRMANDTLNQAVVNQEHINQLLDDYTSKSRQREQTMLEQLQTERRLTTQATRLSSYWQTRALAAEAKLPRSSTSP